MKSPYEILGLEPGASKDEAKKAYKSLAKKYHPDINKEPGAEDKFKEINSAYESIMNGTADHNPRQDFGFGFGAGSIFDDVFDFQFRHPTNLFQQIYVPIEILINGGRFNVRIDVPKVMNNNVFMVNVNYPLDLEPNTPIGKQIPIKFDGVSVTVIITPTPSGDFMVNGLDLISKIDIDVLDLCTGTKVEIHTATGSKLAVNIPAATQPNQTLCIRGHGLTDIRGNKGNLLVRINSVVPKLSDEQIEELKKIKVDIKV